VKKNPQQTSLAPPESAQPDGPRRKPPRRKPPAPSPRRAWQMAMHQHVHELAAEGNTQAEIISRLHLHQHTVRTYLRMPTFVAHYCHPHPSPVEPYRAYLEERGPQGEVMITTLWHELQGQGFTGSYKSVWTSVAQLASSGKDDSHVFFFLCGCLDSSGCTCHPNTVAGEMAVVAQARGTECQGYGLPASIVWSVPVPFVSLRARPGLCSPDP